MDMRNIQKIRFTLLN